jgi:hypothetical protein
MGEHCKGGKSKPVNLGLYNRIKSMVKRKVKRWPSAYASGQVVRMYKQKGGKYRCTSKSSKFGESGLNRWFKERWVDVCTGKPCGRNAGERRKYPYCRPSRRISSKTPKFKIPLSVLKKRCAIKHRIKGKRITRFGKTFTLNLKSKSSIMSLRKIINRTQPPDCLNWEDCKSWTYFISEPIKDITKIKFRLVRKPFKINKTPGSEYKKYINDPSHCGMSTIFSSKSDESIGLVIPCKPYINLNDFSFNAPDTEWYSLWNTVRLATSNMKKPFYITTHGHGVNWLHIRLENKLKYNVNIKI